MTLPVGHERGASLHVVWIEANGAFARLVEGGLEAVGFSMVSWSEADTDRVRFDEFFALEGDARARLAQVQDLLLAWSEGEHWKAGVHRLPVCDWSEAWKRFFHTERISARIVVKPSWERYEPEVGDCVVELDPGMSFGTGLHPTTRACLRFLDQQGLNRPGATFLDIGCGSGILAIAAAKLGFAPVTAIDYDADAVRIARENCTRNGVADRVTCEAGDVAKGLSGRCADVVAANLFSDILERHAPVIAGCVGCRPQGALLLAGMLTRQYPRVLSVYESLGFDEAAVATEDEWTSVYLISSATQRPA